MAAVGRLAGAGRTALLLAVWAHPAVAESSAPQRCEDIEVIGIASMDDDKVVILRLSSRDHGRIIEGRLVYRPADKDYASILAHIGGLRPGQSKSVPPWC